MTYHGGHHSGPLFFSAFIIRHFQGARQACHISRPLPLIRAPPSAGYNPIRV